MTNKLDELNKKTVNKIISITEDYHHHVLTAESAMLMIGDVLIKHKEQQEGLLDNWKAFDF